MVRHVVLSWPDTARGEHHVVVAALLGDFPRDQVDLVGHDGDPSHVAAERAELAAEIGRVDVRGLAREDLVADEDDSGRLRHGLSRFYDARIDRKSTRLNSSHQLISYAVFCLKKKKK